MHADVDLDRALVAGRDAHRDPPACRPISELPCVHRREDFRRLLYPVDSGVSKEEAMPVRRCRLALSLCGALGAPHLEEIAEVGIDGDVGFERGRAGPGILDRPLIGDRAVNANAPLDAQGTERIPEQPAVGKDLGGTQPELAGPGCDLVRRNVARVPGVYPSATL